MAKPRQSLSQGLSASLAQKFITESDSTQAPHEVSVQQIQLSKQQPRRYFDPEKQSQLMQSIQEHGILEPLLVRPLSGGNYELVAGERRYRAAQALGLQEVPVVIRQFDDRQALQVALIENLQREDLNPVEETEGILELLALEIGGTPKEIISILHRANHAKHRGQELEEHVHRQFQAIESVLSKVGRFSAESFRTTRLPLLNLPDDVMKVLRQGKIEYTKARAIARVKDEKQRANLLKQAIAKNLSLSEIKVRIQALQSAKQEAVPEETLEKVAAKRWTEIGKRLQKSQIWSDRKKRDRLTKLLEEIDKLTSE